MTVLPPAEIRTERLLLRKPVPEDAPHIFDAYANDPEVTRYLSWRPHSHVDETARILKRFIDGWPLEGREKPYMICLGGQPDDPIGSVGIKIDGHEANYGYVLAQAHWGQGYLPEALTVLVDWALAQPSIWRATAFCDVENPRSARVMEKAGMHFEARLRRYFVHPNISDGPRDSLLYARVRDDLPNT